MWTTNCFMRPHSAFHHQQNDYKIGRTDYMSRVLVTGHHGYIGSVMVDVLSAEGHDVVGLDTCFYEGCDFGADRRLVPSIRKDVRDIAVADLRGFDAVVHLA